MGLCFYVQRQTDLALSFRDVFVVTFSCNSSAPDATPPSTDPAEAGEAAADSCALWAAAAAETRPLMVLSALAFLSPSRNETRARETGKAEETVAYTHSDNDCLHLF